MNSNPNAHTKKLTKLLASIARTNGRRALLLDSISVWRPHSVSVEALAYN